MNDNQTDMDAARSAGEATAAGPANDGAPATEPGLAERLAAAEAEIGQLKDQVLRTAAETENTRRRLERDKDAAVAAAAGRFARDVLTVADNLRRALESVPAGVDLSDAVKNMVVGVEMTERELLSVFERHGIKRIDSLGQRFDPNLHAAMFEVEDQTKPPGTVVQVLQHGFTIAGRLLRAAQVGVSKGGPKPEAGAGVDTRA